LSVGFVYYRLLLVVCRYGHSMHWRWLPTLEARCFAVTWSRHWPSCFSWCLVCLQQMSMFTSVLANVLRLSSPPLDRNFKVPCSVRSTYTTS